MRPRAHATRARAADDLVPKVARLEIPSFVSLQQALAGPKALADKPPAGLSPTPVRPESCAAPGHDAKLPEEVRSVWLDGTDVSDQDGLSDSCSGWYRYCEGCKRLEVSLVRRSVLWRLTAQADDVQLAESGPNQQQLSFVASLSGGGLEVRREQNPTPHSASAMVAASLTALGVDAPEVRAIKLGLVNARAPAQPVRSPKPTSARQAAEQRA
jgi:hypothetical protein